MFFSADDDKASGGGTRCILNLGGISNVTVLRPADNLPTLGFDTGPANTLLDTWCQKHLGLAVDRYGSWAKSGTVHQELLDHLMEGEEYFKRQPPKSTGKAIVKRCTYYII